MLLFCVFLATPLRSHADGYQRIEASFNIPGLATDPFDYTVTDVRVQITQPDSSTVSLPAFFDGGTTWRIRHTPAVPGNFAVTGVTLNGSATSISNLSPTNWVVSGAPTSPGFVQIDPANTNRFITDNGRRYYPVGENVAWDSGAATVVNVFGKMGPARENWARVWMNHWDGKNLDWLNSGASPGPLGQLDLTVARKWDSIVTVAEQSGIHFQMVLQHHGQYSTTVDANWNDNPYNSSNLNSTIGFLSSPVGFFTNTTAKAVTKRKLRYAVARWGYSPAVMAWELFNEVQFTDAARNGRWDLVGAWHNEMAQFLRSQDPYHHLITTSSEINQPIWNEMDYYQHHDYPTDYITALRDPQGVPVGQPVKPVFGGEAGRNNTVYYGQHAPLWAGLMGGQSGISQPWYWDTIDSQRCYNLIRPVRDFVLSAGIAEQDVLDKSAPQFTGGPLGPLAFGLGGGFAAATQDTFTVGSSAPDGVATAPPYLQSEFGHPGWTPNGYTFNVNYSVTGTFAVQVNQISAAGATLQISRDGVTQTNVIFPSAGSDVNTNVTFMISVPAGAHSVKLFNAGSDWLVLGNITLNPYVSMVGAYQMGNTNFAALWLWHRTNIYRTTATATISGTLPLGGLKPGNYSGTWWDTFAGAPISNFTFTVADTNPIVLAAPSVLRSVAFFAGPPPQVGVTAPLLTHTFGTNSPPLMLPLLLTNSGGLPLSYSLSVTGANPVTYAALNSTQPGGPVFAWKDISGMGTDVTSNFTALASPKVARDEGMSGAMNIGFAFPFFSGSQTPNAYTQLYLSPNGYIAFTPFSGDTSTNRDLPGSLAPSNCIAFFWDDLVPTNTATRVYADSDPVAGTFTVQFQNVRFKTNANLTVTCQLILKTTGEILMQYQSLGISNACTVGLQNADRSQGLQVAFNQNYLRNNFAIRLTPTPWLGLTANAGILPVLNADALEVSLTPSRLSYGTYTATLLIKTGDAAQPLFTLPIVLNIIPVGTWRQTHFDMADNSGDAADTADPDNDGFINLFEYAFNTDPNVSNLSPISFAPVNDHLTVTFERAHPAPADITWLFEVADDLVSGIWQSGPAFTTQNVTDNLNGTETVSVVDNIPISASTSHYLRIRIISP